MGVRLLVEVLDYAPADLTPAERLVLVVLAEEARDQTRVCWPGMDKLVRRTGLKPDSLRKVFQRLSKRDLEVRVPIKVTEKGVPVFAREGVQTNYRVPFFSESSRDARPASEGERRDARPATQEGPASRHSQDEAGSSSQRGGTVVPMRRDPRPAQEAGPSSRPSPQPPSTSRQPSPQDAREDTGHDEGADAYPDDGGLFPSGDTEKKTPRKPECGSDDDPEFVEWWALYPKPKKKKGAARTAWKKARKIASFEELMQGLKNYITLDPDYLNGYVMHPATWLNGENWANEYDASPPTPRASGANTAHSRRQQETNELFQGAFERARAKEIQMGIGESR